ncbi:Isochorismatase-like protein [Pseudocohnilembus persalinus]|uniref:Isochorismatase-like protein n=1 Tax=Pseudocohnilembus persalinus TaxID=266149 RepID=A0A0V0QB68_PSEPJ|nr:Isochorismatase-like protein [Pseudocohnilembus persalinus]|eukprot:KRW99485.1 Isochorismatase-like protein [Pseudocohnilembus persalinus]
MERLLKVELNQQNSQNKQELKNKNHQKNNTYTKNQLENNQMKRLGRINPNSTIFFNCDIQTGFSKFVKEISSVETTAIQMGKVAGYMNIPVLVTEQNTKAFGSTLDSIKEAINQDFSTTVEKKTFSMVNQDTQQFIQQKKFESVVLYGIEAHVCVQQTCLDLLESGYDVHVLLDGISSIKDIDRKAAIKRMENSGAFLTTSQSVIYELMGSTQHPNFKQILQVVKMPRNDNLSNF